MPVKHSQLWGVMTPGYASGVYYVNSNCHNYITQGLSGNCLYYHPIQLGARVGITSLSCKVTSSGTGSVVRMGIYDNVNGRPQNLLLDAGEISTTTIGVKEITLPSTKFFNPDWYWFCHFASGAPTLDSCNGSIVNGLIGNSSVSTSQVTGLRATLTYQSSLPAIANLSSLLYIPSCPLMWFKTA